jgi:hypothetical protein
MDRDEKTGDGHTYEPLDRDEFKRRIESGFADVYLTSISIIQGIALTILCEVVFKDLHVGDALARWTYIAMTFGTIVGVSFEYNWFVGTHRYSYRFIDTLIPYVIGFFEIGAVFNLGNEYWWLWMSLMYFSGMLAYINTYTHYKLDGFVDRQVYDLFRKNMRQSIKLVAVSSILSFITFSIGNYLSQDFNPYVDMILFVVYLCLLSALLLKNSLFLKTVHKFFNFKH